MRRRTRHPAAALAIAVLATLPPACGPSPAPAASHPPAGEPAPAAAATPSPAVAVPVGEAVCTAAPITARVLSLRADTADSVRIEIALARTPGRDGKPAAGDAGAVDAAVKAIEGMSVLSAHGRRRAFPLRAETGERVGVPPEAPPPGETRTFWATFPRAEGPVSLLLPGCPPMPGLVVPALHQMRAEP